MGNVKIRNHSERTLIVGDALLNPGDVKQVGQEEIEAFKSSPAGKWYFDNCLEVVQEAAPVEAEPVEVERPRKKGKGRR